MGDAEDSGRRWSCPLSLRATKKPRNHLTKVVAVARSRGMTRGMTRGVWRRGRGWGVPPEGDAGSGDVGTRKGKGWDWLLLRR